jgi:hypothetical protein
MIAEIPPAISGFISTKSEILHDHAAPAPGRRVSACARPTRPPRTTYLTAFPPALPMIHDLTKPNNLCLYVKVFLKCGELWVIAVVL